MSTSLGTRRLSPQPTCRRQRDRARRWVRTPRPLRRGPRRRKNDRPVFSPACPILNVYGRWWALAGSAQNYERSRQVNGDARSSANGHERQRPREIRAMLKGSAPATPTSRDVDDCPGDLLVVEDPWQDAGRTLFGQPDGRA